MSYPEGTHPHQSDLLPGVPPDYIPYQSVTETGQKLYGVITYIVSQIVILYTSEIPAYGGYIARDSLYGSSSYCPNATRHHRRHRAQYGSMPHLVFFDTQETAESLGFRPCKRCLTRPVHT